jgi:hypothetical protein
MATSGRDLNPDEIGLIIRLRCAGWSLRAIERELAVTRPTILKYAPEAVVRDWLIGVEGLDPAEVDAMLSKNFRGCR